MPEDNNSKKEQFSSSAHELFISSNGWLRFPQTSPYAPARLICFPPAGAEALRYDAWVSLLPAELELCAVELPEHEQNANTVIEELALTILDHTRPGQKLIFFGSCLGSIWAYEVARYLRDHANIQPDYFFVVTFPAPHVRQSAIDFMRTPAFPQLMAGNFPPDSPGHRYVLSRMPAALYAADLAEQYLPPLDKPMTCPLTAFASAHDQIIDPQLLWTWREYTSGTFHVHMCEGDHFYGNYYAKEFLQTLVGYLQPDMLLA